MPKKKDFEFWVDNFCNFSVRLPWKWFVKILKSHYGFEMRTKRRGSGRLFVRGDIRFSAHEPHKREKFVSKPDRQRACGFINSGPDES